ncbi:MAG: hypothetical protein WC503_04130 [Candidatus Shapirobacteria bacterium]
MPAPSAMPSSDLISGAAFVYSIISGLIGIILFLIWRAAIELKNDVRDLFTLHRTCKDELKKDFVSINEFKHLENKVEEISEDRKEKWKAYFAHRHSPTGRVEID